MIRVRCVAASFASTRSAQIATAQRRALRRCSLPLPPHAPRRLQRRNGGEYALLESLCLHTLRADCNAAATRRNHFRRSLPPHAPRRLQRLAIVPPPYVKAFASTRSAQIATTPSASAIRIATTLPPHAPRRLQQFGQVRTTIRDGLCLHTLRADCNGRNAQNCNIHFSERVLSR